MKIILNKDVQNLGEEGDVREVARGYARNYLIPQGFGVAYTKQNLALLEGRRKAIEKRKEEKKERAAGLKERIEALSMQISMTAGENGRLFGSVTNAMIAEELAKAGIEMERKKIEIPEHTIKTVGNYLVKVKLYANETASLKVSVSGPHGTAESKHDRSAAEVEAAMPDTEEAPIDADAEPRIEATAEVQVSSENRMEAGRDAETATESSTESVETQEPGPSESAGGKPAADDGDEGSTEEE